MSKVKLAIVMVVCAAAGCCVQAQPAAGASFGSAEVHKLMRQANSPRQFGFLADYFRAQEHNYRQRAAAEMHEWVRRMQVVTPLSQKYPRPEDSSRYRYEYFMYEADAMSRQADRYQVLAEGAEQQSAR